MRLIFLRGLLRLIVCLFLSTLVLHAAPKWEPVPAAELIQKGSDWSPEAAAEVMSSKVTIHFNGTTTTKRFYRRVKVYGARGVETVQKFGIDHPGEVSIDDLQARVTKPDGRSSLYSASDFKELMLAKVGDAKWKTHRLLLSTLEPGDVVEFRWEESWRGWLLFQSVYCQESLPVRELDFRISIVNMEVTVAWFNVRDVKMTRPRSSEMRLEMKQLPPFVAEPDMPPEFEARGFILVSYGETPKNQDYGWSMRAGWLDSFAKEHVEPNGKIRALAEELCRGAVGDEEKLRRLYEHCQGKLVNLDYHPDEKLKRKRSNYWDVLSAADVLKLGGGHSMEINFLFIALAKAAGYDARLACANDRGIVRDSTQWANGWQFMPPGLAAVKLGSGWSFYSAGNPALACGELRWQDSGVQAMLTDEEMFMWETTPEPVAASNRILRRASLSLASDGTLEGEASLEISGQGAIEWRIQHRMETVLQVEKELLSSFTSRIPEAEISNFQVEGNQSPGKPVLMRFHLRLPSYAPQATGRRLLVPSIFEAGRPPRYPSAKRTLPLVYPYSYVVRDEVEVLLPPDLEADLSEVPKRIMAPDLSLNQAIVWNFDPTGHKLEFTRDFSFGIKGSLQILTYAYTRQIDEELRARNDMAVVLHSSETGGDVAR